MTLFALASHFLEHILRAYQDITVFVFCLANKTDKRLSLEFKLH